MQADWERIDTAMNNHSRWVKTLSGGKINVDTVKDLVVGVALGLPSQSLEQSALFMAADVLREVHQADQQRQASKAGMEVTA